MTRRRTALVTGGSRGIGAATARALASDGLDVAVGYRASRDEAEAVAETVRERGVDAMVAGGDVATQAGAKALVGTVERRWGVLDVLVNCAGVTADAGLRRMSLHAWDSVIATNLSGAFHCTQAALGMLEAGADAAIVNVSSIVGLNGNAGQANYAASKAGLIGLTKSLARELAPRGVTVNAVAGGFVLTDMTLTLDADVIAANMGATPLGRAGEPEDVAGVVAFLCGARARFVTGAVVPVDGGLGL